MNLIQKYRLYLKLKPEIDQLEAVMQMKLSTHSTLQACALAIQMLNYLQPVASGKAKFWVATGVSFIQLVAAVVAHFSNPDGTNARVAWRGDTNGDAK
jgi:hypothetical protein